MKNNVSFTLFILLVVACAMAGEYFSQNAREARSNAQPQADRIAGHDAREGTEAVRPVPVSLPLASPLPGRTTQHAASTLPARAPEGSQAPTGQTQQKDKWAHATQEAKNLAIQKAVSNEALWTTSYEGENACPNYRGGGPCTTTPHVKWQCSDPEVAMLKKTWSVYEVYCMEGNVEVRVEGDWPAPEGSAK